MAPLVTCPSCGIRNRVDPQRAAVAVCGRCHQALPQGAPVILDAPRFFDFISRHQRPVLVDFWAPWCAPCRMMAPALDRVARSRTDLVVAKVDTQQNSQLASRYDISAIPTLILFMHGRLVQRHSGALTPVQLEDLLSRWLPVTPSAGVRNHRS